MRITGTPSYHSRHLVAFGKWFPLFKFQFFVRGNLSLLRNDFVLYDATLYEIRYIDLVECREPQPRLIFLFLNSHMF